MLNHFLQCGVYFKRSARRGRTLLLLADTKTQSDIRGNEEEADRTHRASTDTLILNISLRGAAPGENGAVTAAARRCRTFRHQ